MLRNTGLYWAAAMLLSGCDLFSTREFRPKPPEIRSLQGLSAVGDSVVFRVTESLWAADARAPASVISRKRLVFTAMGDSLDGADTLKILSLSVADYATGALLETGRRLVRFAAEGVYLEGSDPDGGARYFPLKTTAGTGSSGGGSRAGARPDSGTFPVLPSLFAQGWAGFLSLGVLNVRRELAAIDTVEFHGHLEEAWVVGETVLDGETPLSEGRYLYGASGLLKAEQVWREFEWLDSEGDESARVELRRLTERL